MTPFQFKIRVSGLSSTWDTFMTTEEAETKELFSGVGGMKPSSGGTRSTEELM